MANTRKRVTRSDGITALVLSSFAVVAMKLWFDLDDPGTFMVFGLMCFTAVIGLIKTIFPDN